MTGLELSKGYWNEYGRAMMQEQFPQIYEVAAIGLVGTGSECFGFDDEVSQDRNFMPGFCIFIPGEDVVSKEDEMALKTAYALLPHEYGGFMRTEESLEADDRYGVFRIGDFFNKLVEDPMGEVSVHNWFELPSYRFLEATSGEIFEDNYGMMSHIRASIAKRPYDIRVKSLAAEAYHMWYAGQYDYMRSIFHGEHAAAQLLISQFCLATMKVVFLLNDSYMPYYKWAFRAMRDLPILGNLGDDLELLMITDNTTEHAMDKQVAIADITKKVIEQFRLQKLTDETSDNLKLHAFSINEHVKDPEIKAYRIFYGE